jgi:predicted transcriptional regulator of viral defense system
MAGKLSPILVNMAVEPEQFFAALLHAGAKLTIGIPDQQQSKPYTKRLQNGEAPPLMLPAPSKKPRSKNGAGVVMLSHMAKHPKSSHTMADLVKACERNGVSKGAASVGMTKLMKDGKVERIGTGLYTITGLGIGDHKSQPPRKHKQRASSTNRAFLLALFKEHTLLRTADIADKFRKDQRETKSISPQISKLEQQQFIKRVNKGTYQLTERGAANDAT